MPELSRLVPTQLRLRAEPPMLARSLGHPVNRGEVYHSRGSTAAPRRLFPGWRRRRGHLRRRVGCRRTGRLPTSGADYSHPSQLICLTGVLSLAGHDRRCPRRGGVRCPCPDSTTGTSPPGHHTSLAALQDQPARSAGTFPFPPGATAPRRLGGELTHTNRGN